jgi:hypothetical protein
MYVSCTKHNRLRDVGSLNDVPDNTINEDLQEDNKNEEANPIQIDTEGYGVPGEYRNPHQNQKHVI